MRRFLLLAGLLSLLANSAFAQSVGQTGAITLGANQSINLNQVGGSAIAIGQTTMSASLPVTFASDQSSLNVAIAPSSAGSAALTPVFSAAVETGHVIKASAGNLYSFEVTSGAVSGTAMIFNSTTVPAAGAVTPAKCYELPANSTVGGGWATPINFSTGISVAFSSGTTCFTKTDSATAFISADAK